MELINETSAQRLQALHPEAAAELARLESALDATGLDPDLLDRCGQFIDAVLRETEGARTTPRSGREQACLAFCEQFVVSVSSVSDAEVSALREHLSPDEVYLFANAVYLIEMSKRLDLTLEAALP